ncbi:MAG TPA: RDD family protein [Terracidiphilus sp.]|nr:RDD family protein [Terracidiphilus sp.]
MPNQATPSPSWKQEVNRRIAEHKNRKGSSSTEPEGHSEAHHSASSRAVAAAARVAARYAKAPSYSEQLADEARAAVRAAEAASRAALEAQAAAESVLAGLEAASAAEPAWEVHTSPSVIEERQAGRANSTAEWAFDDVPTESKVTKDQTSDGHGFEIRWEPDLPVRHTEPAGGRAKYGSDFFEVDMTDWRKNARPAQEAIDGEAIEIVEAALPIHANLIEFPREIVATRKVRPRRAEGPYAALAEQGMQLSIFEVDPGAISIEPVASDVMDEASAPAWTGPEWSGIKLDAQPPREFLDESPQEYLKEPEPREAEAQNVLLAPLSLRLMALVVDGALIMGAVLTIVAMAAANMKDLPSFRAVELGVAAAMLVASALYISLFYALANGTPGMKYAGISLCTFEGHNPTRSQRCGRLVSLILSVLPLGLGMVWAIFDDDHLSWHDRLSRTYLRKC